MKLSEGYCESQSEEEELLAKPVKIMVVEMET